MARKDAQPGKAEAAAERRVQALQLRMAGASYRAIGSRLGVSEAQAHRDVHAELTRLAEKAADAAEQVRTLELERLDAMLLALWPQAKQANQGAIDRVLRLMERRAKLLGIDAPTRIDATLDVYEVIIGAANSDNPPA
jgi:hypothetical protein